GYIKNGNAPEIGSYIFLSGPLWMLPGMDDLVEAENFEVITVIVFSDISMHEEITSIELDSIMFLPCTDFSCKDEGSTGARTKCQLMPEKAEVAVAKKTKSGPIEAFTLEEMGVGTSQSSVGSLPLPSAGPSQSTCSMTSSQSSIRSSLSSAKGSTKKNV
ncbi:hypothetical protein FRC11_001380, partial [Ceratobasidium sp. 423]